VNLSVFLNKMAITNAATVPNHHSQFSGADKTQHGTRTIFARHCAAYLFLCVLCALCGSNSCGKNGSHKGHEEHKEKTHGRL